MAYPLLLLSQGCCHTLVKCAGEFNRDEIFKGNLNGTGKILAASVIFDACLVLTTLVLGILGGVSVISMPTPAFHALIGIGVGTIALWVGTSIYFKCDNLKLTERLINGTGILNLFSCDRKVKMS